VTPHGGQSPLGTGTLRRRQRWRSMSCSRTGMMTPSSGSYERSSSIQTQVLHGAKRGSKENTNGLLRQYFPKGADLSMYSQAQLKQSRSAAK
jgi:hypothetical protein